MIRWMYGYFFCVIGIALMTSLYKDRPHKRKDTASASKIIDSKSSRASATLPTMSELPIRVAGPKTAALSASPPPPAPVVTPERPAPVVTASDDLCRGYDPVNHPEQVLDVLACASRVTGVPIDILFAIWRNETGVVYGSGFSDVCDIQQQLSVRDAYAGTRHWQAMETMAKHFHWKLEGMKCSCGTASKGNNTGYFGGCCGPFQFSGEEMVANAIKYNLDPMTFSGGAVIVGWEIAAHHAFAMKYRTKDTNQAWVWAIRRYFGGADAACVEGNYARSCTYYVHAFKHLTQIHAWYEEEKIRPGTLRRRLTSMASVAWSRKNQAAIIQASN